MLAKSTLVLSTVLLAGMLPSFSADEIKPLSSATPTTSSPAAPAAEALKLSYTVFKINTNAIAMTFDDGPHAKNTPRLLDMLKERGIKATFFLIGRNVATEPQIVRRIVEEGHEIANHTWDHKALRSMGPEKMFEELQKTQDAIVAACNVTPTLYRPPFGAINSKQEKLIQDKFGYTAILWEVDTRDWQSPRTSAKVHDTIMKDTHAGSIILCHDIHETTIDAMPTTLDELKAKGFQFKTVSEMIKLEQDEVKGSGAPKAPATNTPATTATPAPPAPAAK